MKILLAHNTYQKSGGEDKVFFNEKYQLSRNGNLTKQILLENSTVRGFSFRIRVAYQAPWSQNTYNCAVEAIRNFQPDIVHVHNFFPLLTPSIYDACIEAGVPVVQTLHNYRTICPGAMLMKGGKVCEKCVKGSPYQAMVYRCYRNSLPGSCAVARMVNYHRKRKTWNRKVDRFISLTEFARSKFIAAGFSEEKIVVKPNFYAEASGQYIHKEVSRTGCLFVGRLSQEKGIETLLKAWEGQKCSLRLAGDGPLLKKNKVKYGTSIEFLGRLNSAQVSEEMGKATFLVMPSEWYEGFPLVLVEAFAHKLPVVASRLGGMAEIVSDTVTGLHFEPGNAYDLAEKVRWMHEHPEECRRMGENARKVYEERYTPEKNYEMLMDIYHQAIEEHKKRLV